MADAKADLRLDDIPAPGPYDLDHLDVGVAKVGSHPAFIPNAEFEEPEPAVADEIQQIRLVLTCAVTA
jgi:hypothetical protein